MLLLVNKITDLEQSVSIFIHQLYGSIKHIQAQKTAYKLAGYKSIMGHTHMQADGWQPGRCLLRSGVNGHPAVC